MNAAIIHLKLMSITSNRLDQVLGPDCRSDRSFSPAFSTYSILPAYCSRPSPGSGSALPTAADPCQVVVVPFLLQQTLAR